MITFAVAVATVSSRLLPPALAVAVGWWLLRWAAYGRLSPRTPADWPVALLLLTVPVTLWVTMVPDVTRTQVYRLLLGVGLFYALVNWGTSRDRLRVLVVGALAAGTLLALSAPLQVQSSGGKFSFIPTGLYARFTPIVTDLVNPNVLAGTLVVVVPLAFALLLFGWTTLSTPERVVSVLAAWTMTGSVVLMQSRGALMALAVALATLALLRWHRKWWLWVGLALGGGVTLWAAAAYLPQYLARAMESGRSLESRLELWSRGLYIVEDFPFTGVGMGTFQQVTGALYPLFSVPGGEPHAHNLFLQIAIDLGLPGLIAWLAILMLVITAAWQLYGRGRGHDDRYVTGLGAGLLSSQVALVVHGLTDAVTWGMVRTAVVVWGLWGLAIAAWKVHEYMPPGRSHIRGKTLESGTAPTKARYFPSWDRL
ncbi:MAG TPA: O-antigen ligase family protein [Herpetosiphonaceae bacterium]|nr:O-antigen ligase family protein [Herpetosiphonaceae bacterium]